MADTSVKQKIIDKLKDTSNVLVTVSSNPTVDELSAALGITLLINKLNKHATAVFSGAVPPAISFLEPEKTFENTVDSLRDFIIALDKEKADHLRYKVVDDMVKIFITPYRTTISEKDLDFSQGDYNVEMVLAIGVKSEADLDKALESHGRILHDATVATLSLGEPTKLGGMEWTDNKASGYSEMLASLADGIKSDKTLIDEQIATAFLTGIVAATERFSNSKTTSAVMTLAAQLMAAGANQQLIAIKLAEGSEETAEVTDSQDGKLEEGKATKIVSTPEPTDEAAPEPTPVDTPAPDGSLAISHPLHDDVDDATREVAEHESEEAIEKAEDEIASLSDNTSKDEAAPPIDTVTQELSEGLAAVSAGPTELRGAVSAGQWQEPPLQSSGPAMGGTLNATTEQAAAEKKRETDDNRNRTILTHNGSSYVDGTSMFQSPLNAANQSAHDEPSVPDVLAQGRESAVSGKAAPIEPLQPQELAPSLAEIDAQHRAPEDNAMAAIHAAFGGSDEPSTDNSQAAAPLSSMPLPPLPPMPDFSTLPPLPDTPAVPLQGPVPGETLGDMLPPLTPVGAIGSDPVSATTPADPAQFQIPGQQ